MHDVAALRPRLPGIAKAVAVGIPAALLFQALGTPLPWMIGPMLAVGALNLLGANLHPVPFGRQFGQVTLGSAVSLSFTPAVVAMLFAHGGAILGATLSAFVIGGLGALALSRASGVDRNTSFFASVPGGAMAMSVLAEKHGATVSAVALAHSLRVTVVVLVVPFALTYGTDAGAEMVPTVHVPVSHLILWPWLGFGVVLGAIGTRLRVQNAYLLFPIFFGAVLAANGILLSGVPHWLIDFSQLMFGLTLGSSYRRDFFLRYRLFLPFALLNAVFIIVVSAGVGILISWATGLPLATMIIATSPGGMAEMTVTAQVLGLVVPLVVAFHLFRVVAVNMGTQYLYAAGAWLAARLGSREAG